MNNKKKILSKLSDKTKITIFRWWFSAACYFFLAWGTGLKDTLDLIFFLGITIGISTIFIFNPIIYGFFDIERKGRIVNKKYYERTVIEGVYIKLAEIFKAFVVVIFVAISYHLLNVAVIDIFNLTESTVKIPGEPILFGIFYVIYFNLLTWITDSISLFLERKKRQGEV